MGVSFSASLNRVDLTLLLDDVGGGITYIGTAQPGTATSDADWKIKRLDESDSTDIQILWADGDALFDNIWDDRVSLTYTT